MLIIVEGPDGAGKSTFTREIAHALMTPDEGDPPQVDVLHRGRSKLPLRRQALRDYVLSIEDYVPGTRHIVCDRWHFGEMTYAPIYRPATNRDGYGLLGMSGWRWVEMFLTSRGAITIRASVPVETLIERVTARGDDYVSADDLRTINSLYDHAFDVSTSYIGDVSLDGDTADAVAHLIEQGRVYESSVKQLRDFPTYVGVPFPDALLVGDERNVTKHYGEETRLPFMPVDGNSGEFLLESLEDDVWRRVGLVNGNEPGVDLPRLWEALKKPRIVALGINAADAITAAGLDISTRVPHPQYVRRFKRALADTYRDALTLAVNGGPITW